jgi:hypothetical protein
MMKELNKTIGAMFLTDSKFTVQVETPPSMLHPEVNLPENYIQETLQRDMVQRLSIELSKKFQKEIKKEPTHFGGERHKLELFVFTEPMFKHMIEFIVSEMPEERIQEIRSKNC